MPTRYKRETRPNPDCDTCGGSGFDEVDAVSFSARRMELSHTMRKVPCKCCHPEDCYHYSSKNGACIACGKKDEDDDT